MLQQLARIARVAIVISLLRVRNSPLQRRVSLILHLRGRRQRRLSPVQNAALRSCVMRSHDLSGGADALLRLSLHAM